MTLSNPSKTETTVELTLSSGTAEKNVDFTGTKVTIILGDGTELKDVAVADDGSFQVKVPAGQTRLYRESADHGRHHLRRQ
ncbi:hypothetical protein HPY17_06060 [Vibrio cholerae]|uniref:hypothetical protein n=1 Tax=Vibrio cholerae TaxID=666 RepID=UPI001583EC87|nr:hypothetical protein [Vibrio cholerae]QKU62920.1 hypothetical protein HPY17_06060 [Vibrio cholerae]